MKQTITTLVCLMLPCAALAQEKASPVEFVENRGQWDGRARYGAQVGTGARLFVEAKGLTYTLTAGLPDHHAPASAQPQPVVPDGQVPAHALRVEFVGSNAGAHPVGEGPAEGVRHFLRGADPAGWAAGARSWPQLRYHELWPGTDLVLKANADRQFEYDLLLAPGADAGRIRLRYHGADNMRLDPGTGQLQVKTSVGQLTEQQPRAWQLDAAGQPRPVACIFRLRGTELSFELGKYDHRRPLVIDPVVQFASYTGSAVENWGFAATHDAAGNLYTAGVVFDPGYPTTTGAFQVAFNGSTDIAIMKFATTVSGPGARLWATHLGGSGLEFPHSLLVNSRGELLLLGSTSSANYPTTTAAVSRTFRGGPSVAPYGAGSMFVMAGSDIVITRLSASGGGLRASTYLGGTGTDGVLDPLAPAPRLRHNYGDAFRGDLALDPQGNVYLASVSSSADLLGLTSGAYRGGLSDGLVASLDSSLSRVRWATPVGGSGADAAYSLQREEPAGTLLVAGGTTSPNLARATGGYRPSLGGDVDGFVTRLTAAGAVSQSTYLGTAGYDQAYFVRLGPGSKPCVLGQSLGGYRSTAGAYADANGRQFIQQLEPSLQAAGFASVFGSGRAMADISPTAFEVDCYGRILLSGWGGGLDPNNGSTMGLPTTPNALQSRTDGQDFYLMQLSDGARALDYASFFGTSADDHIDGGTSRFDALGTLYQGMCACNQGGMGIPIPSGANYYSAVNGSAQCNNAAFKFAFGPGSNPAGPDTVSVCARVAPIVLGGSPAGGTWSGPGVSGSPSTGYVFVPDTLRLGWQQLTYTSPAGGACAGTSTRRINVLPQAQARLSAPQREVCLQPTGPGPALIPLTGTPAGGTFAGMGIAPGSSSFNPALAGPGNHTIRYEITGGRCPAVASLTIRVKGVRELLVDTLLTVCLNYPPFALYSNPLGGTWVGPGIVGSPTMGFQFDPALAGVGSHWLTYTLPGEPGCPGASARTRVVVRALSGMVRVPADTTLCFSGRPFRLVGGQPAGGRWVGPGVTGSAATGFVFTPSVSLVGNVTVMYVGPVVNPDECPGDARRTIRLTSPQVTLSAPATLFCPLDGPQQLTAQPAGGTWSGPGVTGSAAAGFSFNPRLAMPGRNVLNYSAPPPADPSQCAGSGRLELDVLITPPVAITAVPRIGICAATPPHGIVLTATPAGGTFGGAGVVGNRFNATALGPGRHVVTYTYREPQLGCLIETSQTIEVVMLPPIRLPADTVLCAGQGPFQLRASPAGGTWAGPHVTAAGLFTPPASPGTTVLTYTLPDGCGTEPYRVTVPAEPGLEVRWLAPACDDNQLAPRVLRFQAAGPAAGEVQWDFGDGSPPVTGAVVEHAYAGGGRFVPRATRPGPGGGMCPGQVALPAVDVLESVVPNVFTPDGDGINDTFAPRIGGCPGRLQVFSRWGQRVFDQNSYQGDWAGAGLPAGIYYYLLSPGDGQARVKGWVEIVR